MDHEPQPGPLGEHLRYSAESIWQPAVLRQQQNSLQPPASALPPSLMPLPPSQIYSPKRAGLSSNQVSPLSSELHESSPDKAWSTDPSAADQASTSSHQGEQTQRQPQGRQTPTSLFGRDQPVPDIPQWTPPHPTFSMPNQAVDRSWTHASGGQRQTVEKPSR